MVSRNGAGAPHLWEQDRVAAAPVARLATVRPDGRPHIVPVTFALVAGVVVTAVDSKPKRSTDLQRLRNIAAHPRASLLADCYDDDWSRLWWVRLDGEARVVDDPQRRAQYLTALTAKYEPYRRRPPTGPVVAMAVTSWASWAAQAADEERAHPPGPPS